MRRNLPPNPASAPHIVLILVDDLGYGDLASYGAQDMRTPNIDSLMQAGMRLDNFYANCCVCSPTRAALLTGRYPDLVGVPGVIRTHDRGNWGYLSPSAVLLPDVLQQVGYHTALVGKWHLGLKSPNLPNQRGFDHFHGFLGDMMDDYYTHRRHGNNYMRLNQEVIDPQGHATDLFTDWSIQYIRERAQAKQPFFLYLAYNAPHTPIQPPKSWLEKVRQRQPGITDQRAALVALIEHMDDGIGKVVQALRDTGVAEDTPTHLFLRQRRTAQRGGEQWAAAVGQDAHVRGRCQGGHLRRLAGAHIGRLAQRCARLDDGPVPDPGCCREC